jgi:hypothetical protein
MRSIARALLCLAPLVTTAALAAGTQDHGNWKEVDRYMADEVKKVADACGKKIPYEMDKRSWEAHKDWVSFNPYSGCSSVYSRLASECLDGEMKRKVAKIKKVKCTYSAKESVKASGGVVDAKLNEETADDVIKDGIEKM